MGGNSKGDKGKGKSKGKSKDDGSAFSKIVDVNSCDAEFNMVGAIIGERGENTKHIKAESGARIHVLGGDGAPMYCKVLADTQDILDSGTRMLKELLQSVYADYDAWLLEKEKGEPASKRSRV